MRKMITIEGMSCNHCVKHVEDALRELNDVTEVKVSLQEKNALVEMKSDIDDSLIRSVIEDAGYDVINISKI